MSEPRARSASDAFARLFPIATLATLIGLAVPAPSRAATDRAAEADSLHRRGIERLARGTFESRRLALTDLDQATRLAPDRALYWCDLGRASASVGQFSAARESWKRAASLSPDDPVIRLELGLSWKWDWLSTRDTASLGQAARFLMEAARAAPRDPTSRAALTALALAAGNLDLAYRAAWSAIGAAPSATEARLAWALVNQRVGALARAESCFAALLGDLPEDLRRRFIDVAPVTGRKTQEGERGAAEVAAFWRDSDPDLTTPENEVALDFMARVAHALLLFRDREGPRWDLRAEMFVRYGLPARIDLNPVGVNTELIYKRYAVVFYAPDELAYPYQVQVWSYPELGMTFELWDHALNQNYQLPIDTQRDPDPRPDPGRLAGRDDLVALGDGRGVYRALPPGVVRMEARGQVSRFPADSATRLVAQIEAPGGPLDTLWGAWAVVAADGRVVARHSGVMPASGCAPGERHFANFSAVVPDGDYRVDLAVHDRRGRRGVVRLSTSVAAAPRGLALSDLVLLCGASAPMSRDRIEIEPNLDRNVDGARSISAYFEVDGLATLEAGASRFSYLYRVRRVAEVQGKEKLGETVVEAARTEEHVGTLRRQFLTVPLPRLEAGAYRLEVEVKDENSGAAARGEVRFAAL